MLAMVEIRYALRPTESSVNEKEIGHTLFLNLVNIFTRGQLDNINCVDNMVDTLVQDKAVMVF